MEKKLSGLSQSEVNQRIKQDLINHIFKYKNKTNIQIILNNTFNLFNGLNFLIFILVLLSKKIENSLFMFVVIFNTFIASYQEIKANNLLKKLSEKNTSKVRVLRSDTIIEINENEIVLDDILYLSKNQIVACDGLFLDDECYVNQAIITGESDAIHKIKNQEILKGSVFLSDEGYLRVTKVGNNNYINKILTQVSYHKENNSRIKKGLDFIIKIISTIIIPLGILLFIKLYTNKLALPTIFLQLAGSMIGMIPEGLILLSSVSFFLAIIRLVKYHCLVQNLYSIETLARVNCICLDKTGTITTGKMAVIKTVSYTSQAIELLAKYVNTIDDDNASAKALKEAYKTNEKLNFTQKINFNSKQKFSSLMTNDNQYFLGAYEFLKISDQRIINEIENYTTKGYRVLVFKDLNKTLALIILKDEVRTSFKETLDFLYTQDIKVKIISGDNLQTILAITKQLNIKNDKFIDFSKQTYNNQEYDIYARSNPNDKLSIIKDLKKKYTVAMVGDGINDTLALKEADFSIALNSGFDLTKNIADVVFLNDNFNSIKEIILNGRSIINNISNQAKLFITKTIFSIILSILTLFFLKTYPFIPIQLTIISSFCIGIPSFILTLGQNFNRFNNHFLSNILKHSLISGVAISICITLITIIYPDNYQTLVYITTFSLMIINLVLNMNNFNYVSLLLILNSLLGLIISSTIFNQKLQLQALDNSIIKKSFLFILFGSLIIYILNKVLKKTRFFNRLEGFY